MLSTTPVEPTLNSLPLDILAIIQNKNEASVKLKFCQAHEKNLVSYHQGLWPQCLETLNPKNFSQYINKQHRVRTFLALVTLHFKTTGQWRHEHGQDASQKHLLNRAQACLKMLMTGVPKKKFQQRLLQTLRANLEKLNDEHALDMIRTLKDVLVLSPLFRSYCQKTTQAILIERLLNIVQNFNPNNPDFFPQLHAASFLIGADSKALYCFSDRLDYFLDELDGECQWVLLGITHEMIEASKNDPWAAKETSKNLLTPSKEHHNLLSTLNQKKTDRAYELIEAIESNNRWITLLEKRSLLYSPTSSSQTFERFLNQLAEAASYIPAEQLIDFLKELIIVSQDDPLTFLLFSQSYLAEAIQHSEFDALHGYCSRLIAVIKRLLLAPSSNHILQERTKLLCFQIMNCYSGNARRWSRLKKLRLIKLSLPLFTKNICLFIDLPHADAIAGLTQHFWNCIGPRGLTIDEAEDALCKEILDFLSEQTRFLDAALSSLNPTSHNISQPGNYYRRLQEPHSTSTKHLKKLGRIRYSIFKRVKFLCKGLNSM